MSALIDYVVKHTRQADTGVDMVFFKVEILGSPGLIALQDLVRSHQGEFGPCNVLDGEEHGYMELGGWVGDQGLALRMMALGQVLGLWKVHTPRSMFGNVLDEDKLMNMAGMGMISVKHQVAQEASPCN